MTPPVTKVNCVVENFIFTGENFVNIDKNIHISFCSLSLSLYLFLSITKNFKYVDKNVQILLPYYRVVKKLVIYLNNGSLKHCRFRVTSSIIVFTPLYSVRKNREEREREANRVKQKQASREREKEREIGPPWFKWFEIGAKLRFGTSLRIPVNSTFLDTGSHSRSDIVSFHDILRS